ERATTASSMLPRTTSSMESAMISRLMREVFIPSVPIVIPSLTVTVLNSSGVPPAARTPSFTFAARRRRWQQQGPISVQVLAIATSGFSRSSRVNPVAAYMARAGARSGPSVMMWLRCFNSEAMAATFRGSGEGTCYILSQRPLVRFALTYHIEGPRERPSLEIYEEVAAKVELADRLGFDYAWFAEHHSHIHLGHLPCPLLLALHLAGRTQRIHLGTAVICLNMHDAVEVAEQAAVADLLTGGRIS